MASSHAKKRARTPDRRNVFRRIPLLAAAAAVLLLAGCGYRFTPDGGDLPGGIRTVFIPVFKNDTAEAGMGGWCTDALRTELGRRNKAGGEGSDGVVEGRILEVRDPTAIYTTDADGTVRRTSARVSGVVEIRLVNRADASAVRTFKVRGSEDYLVSSSLGSKAVMEDDASRRQAIRRLCDNLMREASERLQTF